MNGVFTKLHGNFKVRHVPVNKTGLRMLKYELLFVLQMIFTQIRWGIILKDQVTQLEFWQLCITLKVS